MIHPRDAVFLLLPRFSMIALYSALEPLRVANRFRPGAFAWRFVSVDGEAVTASNGIPVFVEGTLAGVRQGDLVIVSASYDHEQAMRREVFNELRRLARSGALLGGTDTGAFLLAGAGVLDGYRATCHWETLPAFRETFPRVVVEDARYVIDRGRLTASGGTSALDMMLDWLAAIEGEALAAAVAETLVHDRHPGATGEGRASVSRRYAGGDPRLLAAIAAMEGALEEPLPILRIAAVAGVSQRQLDRLFRARFGAAPKAVYLRLRLERAERLLTYSKLSVREVALATGFGSLAQFSRTYKARLGVSPSRQRGRPVPSGG
jgi:AraC family transcriptional regulator, carnitine catabolism transcriptional activator